MAAEAPGPGQVVVDVHGCGVCGSNLPVWEGRPWFEYPLEPGAPGHEAWGVVADVGPGSTTLSPGDAVALIGSGTFRDRALVDENEAVLLPEGLASAVFPGEALGCGFNVARRSGFRAGEVVAVVGVGFLGAIVARIAARAGARVIAISRRRSSLDVATAFGADEVIEMGDRGNRGDVVSAVADLTGGSLCSTVVEAVGLQDPLDLAGELTAIGGRLVIAGYHQDSPRSVDMQLWNWRGIDVVNAHERDQNVVRRGVLEAADAVLDGWFDPSVLYTHHFQLEQLHEALDIAVERPPGFVKALVVNQ